MTRYNVYRSTTSGFTPERGEPDRADRRHDATATSALAAGTYYYKVTAEDAAGNVERALERGERDDPRHDTADRARPT